MIRENNAMVKHSNREAVEGAESLLPPNFAAVLWRRRWSLAAFLLGAVLIGGLYAILAQPVYQTTARLMIQREGSLLTETQNTISKEDILATQAEVIRSPAVLSRAMKTLALPPADPGGPDPMAAIMESLVIAPVLNAEVLTLTCTDPDPEQSVRKMKAIVDAYQADIQANQHDTQIEALRLLTRSQKELRDELDSLQEDYVKLRESGPLIGQGNQTTEVQATALLRLRDMVNETTRRRIELENQLHSLDVAAKNGEERPYLIVAATPRLAGSSGATGDLRVISAGEIDIHQAVLRAKAREQQALLYYGPDHPDVIAARQEIESWQKALKDSHQAGRKAIEEELANVGREEKELTNLCQQEYEKAKIADVFHVKDQQALASIQRVQELYTSTLGQLKQWQLADQTPAAGKYTLTVRVLELSPQALPVIVPPPLLVLPACLLLGLLGGVGLVILQERFTTTVQSPDQVRSALAHPVIGHVPTLAAPRGSRTPRLDRGRVVCCLPQSAAAEAFRAIRMRLSLSDHHGDGLLVQVTSGAANDGKTTLAANLACSFARLGKRVAIVDADIRNGILHQVFDVPMGSGLADVLEGKGPIDAALTRSRFAPIDTLVRGATTDGATDLLAQPAFEQLLGWLRHEYEVVIFDSPALLTDSTAAVLASKVDDVLLSVRVGHSSLAAASRACELLESLGKPPRGIVVQQTEAERAVAPSRSAGPDAVSTNGARHPAAAGVA